MRKIITILIVSAALFAACEKKEGDFTIDTNGTITAYKGDAKELVIPDQIDDVLVTAIWSEVFSYKGLSSVTIPDSVVYIGRNAFSGNQLTRITIRSDLKLARGDTPSFDNNFDLFYDANKSEAGTYIFNGRQWSMK
jgi:hypothetical protein